MHARRQLWVKNTFLQPVHNHTSLTPSSSFPSSEDCLTLDIYTPTTNPQANLSVMMWIYGGGFTSGDDYENGRVCWDFAYLPHCELTPRLFLSFLASTWLKPTMLWLWLPTIEWVRLASLHSPSCNKKM